MNQHWMDTVGGFAKPSFPIRGRSPRPTRLARAGVATGAVVLLGGAVLAASIVQVALDMFCWDSDLSPNGHRAGAWATASFCPN